MPIYEYICKECDESFSVFRGINIGEKDTKCPRCNSNDVTKKISSFSCCSTGGSTSFFGSSGFGGG